MNKKVFESETHILGPFEKINLYLPFLFIAVSLYYLLLGHRQTVDETWAWNIVAAYIFFNASHVGLTFIILLFIPEGQSLVKKSLLQKKPIVVLSIFVLVYLFSISLLKKQMAFSSPILLLIFFIPVLLLNWHTLKQSFGMLMLYNSKFSRASSAPTFNELKIERILFQSLTGLYVIYQFDRIIYKENLLINRHIWLCLIFLASFATIYFVFKISFLKNKKIYILRLLLYPLGMVSPVAAAGIRATHGLEYTFLTTRMISNSTCKNKIKLYICCGSFLLFLTCITMVYSKTLKFATFFDHLLPDSSDDFKGLMLTLLFTIEYFHYYLDGLIFKFSTSLVKEEI